MTTSNRLAIVMMTIIFAGCQEMATAPADAAPDATSAALTGPAAPAIFNQGIAAARSATAAFHNFDMAVAAGYSDRITDCFENPPVGGMGYHWANLALFDDVVDATHPETLVYEPQVDGTLRLVALEYIVPFAAWTASTPPMLFGQEFEANSTFGIWALHLWIWRNNPNGMFADWNPNVSCRYAT